MAMWEALQLCQREGKIRHIGVSNFARKHIEGMLRDPRLVFGTTCLRSQGYGLTKCVDRKRSISDHYHGYGSEFC